MIDLNVKALHYLTKGAAKIMDRQGYGYILNVASSAGLIPAVGIEIKKRLSK